jgi:hypothetical protein
VRADGVGVEGEGVEKLGKGMFEVEGVGVAVAASVWVGVSTDAAGVGVVELGVGGAGLVSREARAGKSDARV